MSLTTTCPRARRRSMYPSSGHRWISDARRMSDLLLYGWLQWREPRSMTEPFSPMTEPLNPLTPLRPARAEDFDYCARLYFEGMENIIKQLNLNMEAQLAGFRQRWDVTQIKIITLDGTDIGWLQSFVKEDALFLAQLFVDRALQGRGIGTAMVKALIEEASTTGRALTL